MAELSRHRSDAPEQGNQFAHAHNRYVRAARTYVNVESVHRVRETSGMSTTGETLSRLRSRAGMSLEAVARASGYAGRSGVQRYFSAEYEDRLDIDVAERLAQALTGKGNPPIARQDVLNLTGLSTSNEVRPVQALAPKYYDLPKDVPVYGTAIGSARLNDDVVEQTIVHQADPIDYFLRPPGVSHRTGIYGVYIAGSSQSPRFEEGEIAFVDPNRPPMIGDDVVVYIVSPEDEGDRLSAVLIKRLLRRTSDYIELRQFNPPHDFQIPSYRVSAIHRVLPNAEMLTGY